ncbi:hypothetical protein PUP66_18520 [Pseudomonas chlororaphis]|uniref:hypothetical protein n=1 Tax=Pseudomonas chlororaphis TaxID=587753 RepID=UPI000F551D3C|nr:hypothetical protein [Pseudomonas chlororaphis]AZD16470.1 hypothetical protein C4K25_3543 [Pseudomonas chlororaphis]WDH45107.1 hypothetical protein PUP66_18520 [Pseudomonas chlororaphis]WDH56953.1 hypothetical protein PUP56_18525 [Pseudomonas chlororaphis]WQE16212.1 hypothetical protein U0007_17335 [Pseudomonas chlororaphis]
MYQQRARSFTGVTAFRKNYVVIMAVDDELADQNTDHSIVFRYADEKWGKKTLDTAIRGAIVLEDGKKILAMGVDGKILTLNLPGLSEEQVDPSDDGPSDLLTLRAMRVINGEIYLAGMGRHAYKKSNEKIWLRIDNGVFLGRDRREYAIGFNCIDGFSEEDIYCAGYLGEIWRYNGKHWMQEHSPTNVVLNAIECAGDGYVYICGMAGTIIRGRDNAWEVIEQDLTKSDFWGMTYFCGSIYISSYDGIFKIVGDDIEKLDLDINVSTAYLDSADGRIWSVGLQDIAYSDDAITWIQVANP